MLHSRFYLSTLLFSCLGLHLSHAVELSIKLNSDEKQPPEWLQRIPKQLDKIPTFLPEESNQPIVPPLTWTQAETPIDEKQSQFSSTLQGWANDMDGWFGQVDTKTPATANVQIFLDSTWNKYDGYQLVPRIRGRVRLPTLEKRLSLVFGDDNLANEIRNNVTISNPPPNPTKQTFNQQQTINNNSSLALRWDNWRAEQHVKTSVDLGVRAGPDVFVRLKGQKDWDLGKNFYGHAEQIYRYGSKSEHYLQTNLELRYARPEQAFLANQFSFTYQNQDGLTQTNWDNRLFRQHQFFKDNQFSYGLYTGGSTSHDKHRLNSYGPFVDWRQPWLREWFFVQSEVNYFNDQDQERSHTVGVSLRLESQF